MQPETRSMFETRNTAIPKQRIDGDEAVEVTPPFMLNMRREQNIVDLRPQDRSLIVEDEPSHDVDPKDESSSAIEPVSQSEQEPDVTLTEPPLTTPIPEPVLQSEPPEENASAEKVKSENAPTLPIIF